MIFDTSLLDDFNRANGQLTSPWVHSYQAGDPTIQIETTSVAWNGANSSNWFGGAIYTSLSGLDTECHSTFVGVSVTTGEWWWLLRAQNVGTNSFRSYFGRVFTSGGNTASPVCGIFDDTGSAAVVLESSSGDAFPVAVGDTISVLAFNLPDGRARVGLYHKEVATGLWRPRASHILSGAYVLGSGPVGVALKVSTGGQHQRFDDFGGGTITAPSPTLSSDTISGFGGGLRDRLADPAFITLPPAGFAYVGLRDRLADRAFVTLPPVGPVYALRDRLADRAWVVRAQDPPPGTNPGSGSGRGKSSTVVVF